MTNGKDHGTPIPGYLCKYFINPSGQIWRRTISGALLPVVSRIDRAGYCTVRLLNKGQAQTKFVHRLVAETFIPNPEGKKFVNHLNGLKTDNRVSNICWATHSENIKHGYDSGLITAPGKIAVEDQCTGRKFESIKAAADYYSIPYSTCKNYLSGRYKNPTCLNYADKK